jgi:hypothetical protein
LPAPQRFGEVDDDSFALESDLDRPLLCCSLDVSGLIQTNIAAVEDDPTWWGSQAQLSALHTWVAAELGRDILMQWGDPGKKSSANRALIILERPAPPPEAANVERLALVVFHEALHIKHSDDEGSLSYARHLASLGRANRAAVASYTDAIFNALEDVRVAGRELLSSETNAARFTTFNIRIVEQNEERYVLQYSESPWLANPKSSLSQSHLALLSRIYLPEETRTLHPAVAAIVKKSSATIDDAVGATSTARPRTAAGEIIAVVRRYAHALY